MRSPLDGFGPSPNDWRISELIPETQGNNALTDPNEGT